MYISLEGRREKGSIDVFGTSMEERKEKKKNTVLRRLGMLIKKINRTFMQCLIHTEDYREF